MVVEAVLRLCHDVRGQVCVAAGFAQLAQGHRSLSPERLDAYLGQVEAALARATAVLDEFERRGRG